MKLNKNVVTPSVDVMLTNTVTILIAINVSLHLP
jgi:hypothetical protein